MSKPRPQPLLRLVQQRFPDLADAALSIEAGHVEVDGRAVTTPSSQFRADAHIRLAEQTRLRGEVKLTAALEQFAITVTGRCCLDVGAAAGGFTRTLLSAGARRVYAVDVGHGQLLGSLRQDPRVITLELTNVSALTRDLIEDSIDVISIDVSYLALAAAVAQLSTIEMAPGCDLVGLVKPMFELRRATAPTDRRDLDSALAEAVAGIERSGWQVIASMDSPVTGARGARELLLHARRS